MGFKSRYVSCLCSEYTFFFDYYTIFIKIYQTILLKQLLSYNIYISKVTEENKHFKFWILISIITVSVIKHYYITIYTAEIEYVVLFKHVCH